MINLCIYSSNLLLNTTWSFCSPNHIIICCVATNIYLFSLSLFLSLFLSLSFFLPPSLPSFLSWLLLCRLGWPWTTMFKWSSCLSLLRSWQCIRCLGHTFWIIAWGNSTNTPHLKYTYMSVLAAYMSVHHFHACHLWRLWAAMYLQLKLDPLPEQLMLLTTELSVFPVPACYNCSCACPCWCFRFFTWFQVSA